MDETQLFHLKLAMRCYSSVHVQSAACRISLCWMYFIKQVVTHM